MVAATNGPAGSPFGQAARGSAAAQYWSPMADWTQPDRASANLRCLRSLPEFGELIPRSLIYPYCWLLSGSGATLEPVGPLPRFWMTQRSSISRSASFSSARSLSLSFFIGSSFMLRSGAPSARPRPPPVPAATFTLAVFGHLLTSAALRPLPRARPYSMEDDTKPPPAPQPPAPQQVISQPPALARRSGTLERTACWKS